MDKFRILFKKTGRAIYTSHLDVMHTMQRAFSRAGYELKYSEGFNPHPNISVLMPLSVGAASVCEIMEFRLAKEYEDILELPERLTAALPEGIEVVQIYEPTRKSIELKWLEVEGVFEYDERSCEEMKNALDEFFSAEQIVMTKKTKRGMGETDIKPGIRSISFEAEDKYVKVKAVVSAQEPTINPDLLPGALNQNKPEIAPDFAKFIRIEVYDSNMQIYR